MGKIGGRTGFSTGHFSVCACVCVCVCVVFSVLLLLVCVRVCVCHKVIVNECSSVKLGQCPDIIVVMYRLSFNRQRIEMVSLKGM